MFPLTICLNRVKFLINLGGAVTKRQVFSTKNAPLPLGPYSQAIIYGDLLFVSGQGPIDPATNKVVDNNITLQTRQILTNIKAIVEESGFFMSNVLKVTVFLDDIGSFTKFNEVYKEFFDNCKPARSCIQAGGLPGGWKAEVEVIVGR
jgi:2-iminobutanoate/2-iminopropanoate deaminase